MSYTFCQYLTFALNIYFGLGVFVAIGYAVGWFFLNLRWGEYHKHNLPQLLLAIPFSIVAWPLLILFWLDPT